MHEHEDTEPTLAPPASRTSPARARKLRAAVFALGLVTAATGACGDGDDQAQPETERPEAQEVEVTLNDALQAHVEGRLSDAEEGYRRVLEVDEENKFAIYNLGLIDHTTGRLSDAEERYRRVLELDPAYGPALFNLAIIRSGKGDTDDAMSLYRRAIQAEPDNASAHLNLGLLLRSTGETEEAAEMFRRARELDPGLDVPGGDTPAQEPAETREP